MSASARRTLDTDNITLRTVYARGTSNTNIQSTLVLTADGRGGTRWTHPSSLGAYTLNYISTDTRTIGWDLSQNNIFYLTGGQGIGIGSTANAHEANVYAKAYQALYDRNTESTMTVEDSAFFLFSTIYFSTTTQQFYTTMDRTQQTVYWNLNPFRFLTGNVSSPNFTNFTDISYNEIQFNNINSTIRMIGTKDIQFSTISTFQQQSLYVSISTFTSEGYLGISGEVSSLRGLSTTMPYHFRSTFLLNASNAFLRTGFLSTPQNSVFNVSYTGSPIRPGFQCTVISSIGFPYTAGGLRGPNPIQQFSEPDASGNFYTVSIVEDTTFPYNSNGTFSSFTFRLDPFSTFINRNNSTSIVLSYTPTFLFSGYSTSGTNANINTIPFSTFITAGNETLPNTLTDDVLYFTNPPPFQQNFYKGNFNINIEKAILLPRYTCTFTVNHTISRGLGGYSNANPATWPATSYNFTRTGLSSATFTSFTPERNSAYLTIIGS
jgi:hypothetical protein